MIAPSEGNTVCCCFGVLLQVTSKGQATTSPDFFVGAHVAVAGYRLVTTGRSRTADCFPGVEPALPGESSR